MKESPGGAFPADAPPDGALPADTSPGGRFPASASPDEAFPADVSPDEAVSTTGPATDPGPRWTPHSAPTSVPTPDVQPPDDTPTDGDLDNLDDLDDLDDLEPVAGYELPAEFLAGLGTTKTTTSWSPHRAVDVERVERMAEALARWELGSVHRLRAAAHHAVASEPEYLVLSELAVRPGGLTGAVLAGIVGVGSGGISGILMRLEEQELLERAPDPDDGRGMVSFATDAGREFLRNEVGDVADRRGVADLLKGLRPYQVDLIVTFLGIATNRAYRQSQHLRDQRRRRR